MPLTEISLTVQQAELLMGLLHRTTRPMIEAIAAFFIVLSVGILIAHAMDAFRP